MPNDGKTDSTKIKHVERQVLQDEAQLADLRRELLHFEQRYRIASSDFYARYLAGQAGDNLDAFEWNATYKINTDLLRP